LAGTVVETSYNIPDPYFFYRSSINLCPRWKALIDDHVPELLKQAGLPDDAADGGERDV